VTFEEWREKYQPIKNDIASNAAYDGIMFETYGPEVEKIKNRARKFVWTLLEEDDHLWIAPGYHFVNRLGYFICKFPHEFEDLEIILGGPDDFDTDEEEEEIEA
jgi:hypothetical protein